MGLALFLFGSRQVWADKPSHPALDNEADSTEEDSEPGEATKSGLKPGVPVFAEVRSVPYPSGALYVRRGLCGAFLGGQHQNLGDSLSLYQWQGEATYYYTPWFSGGVGFRIRAGEPSAEKQIILNRYFLLLRFNKDLKRAAIYIGPQLGLNNLNVLNGKPKGVATIVDSAIGGTGASLGLDIGGGWKFSRWISATLGTNLEYSLVGVEGRANNNSLNINVNPGIAIDILTFTNSLRKLVPALYVNIEYQVGFLLLEKNRHRNDQAEILGLGLAF